MPFITKDRRDTIDQVGLSILHLKGGIMPGDKCYLFYEEMVARWKERPRWTTAHEIYKEILCRPVGEYPDDDNMATAQSLAWQVFFQLYVMPYELKKREENGDI
jgi:hypothetical protein